MHGGVLRQKKLGRGLRPLSGKEPLHLVLKAHRRYLKYKSLRAPANFWVIQKVFKRYAARFGVKIEQLSIQSDHCHVLIRASRRRNYQSFFRVVAGQIVQRMQKLELLMTDTSEDHNLPWDLASKSSSQPGTWLWEYRPFSRVVRGYRAYKTVRDYIQLNEQEALGKIRYTKLRLKGLPSVEWPLLWS